MLFRLRLLCLTALCLLAAPAAAAVCDALWVDRARGRAIPVRIQLPESGARLAAIIWSPGLGATTSGGGVWARGWLAAGFAVITVQHPGSDNIAYAREPAATRPARLRRATSGLHMAERAGDVGLVLDELARRPREGACDLARIDPDRIGVAGHSLGAWTVQALAGQRFGGERGQIDRRPRAFIGLSGSQLEPGDPAAIFGGIGRPYLMISGTLDGAGDGDIVARRTMIWRGLPADGRKYMALFGDATHMMFAGNRPATTALGRRVEAEVIRLSTAFWRRWLLDDAAADAVLAHPGLPAADRWEHK
ncbi:hypothetical protein CHU93_06395 [Sandarakinorhabdus cyanobacteriorum]|uniref:Dienelactone hydrolase n=1 Tax=Sandarakinorhabdus cyanobacteriorum TaxID=1981098 RepID=A0A255YNI6_9SPHN|nr:hypothetical protein CHU93_06395 [Sandarakinorhabdus cyanobacteriorum]